MIDESRLWDDEIAHVLDGDVYTWDGRPVHFRSVLARAWGWPKAAAVLAADWLLEYAHDNGVRASLWLSRREREAQQDALFAAIPNLRTVLCRGLSRRAQREVYDASHVIDGVTVHLDKQITDDGLTTSILHAVAQRLGCNMDEVREATHFSVDSRHPILTVRASQFEFEGDQ